MHWKIQAPHSQYSLRENSKFLQNFNYYFYLIFTTLIQTCHLKIKTIILFHRIVSISKEKITKTSVKNLNELCEWGTRHLKPSVKVIILYIYKTKLAKRAVWWYRVTWLIPDTVLKSTKFLDCQYYPKQWKCNWLKCPTFYSRTKCKEKFYIFKHVFVHFKTCRLPFYWLKYVAK
jgi:hypothetical protein